MKLRYITFTGIDERTDIDRLERIQQQYPYAEFGVLLSYDWEDNGCRFPNPEIVGRLAYHHLNLSAHLCGKMAVELAQGYGTGPVAMCKGYFNYFSRCQLNLRAEGWFNELRTKTFAPIDCKEVIVQMHTPDLLREFLTEACPQNMSFLMDASGGAGVHTPIEIVTSPGVSMGYAGGIGPDNVESKLRTLLEHDSDDEFWIDMETRVRTTDDEGEWLDLDKVEQVLEICDPIIKQYAE